MDFVAKQEQAVVTVATKDIKLDQVSSQIIAMAEELTEEHLQSLAGTQAAGLVALIRQQKANSWRAR